MIIMFVTLLFCIQVACSAVVIEPEPKGGDGYYWSGTGILTITGASKEYTLSNDISSIWMVHVNAQEVTLDGNDVPICFIRGQPTLDLVNVHIDGGIYEILPLQVGKLAKYDKLEGKREERGVYGITECRNIENSSIVVKYFPAVPGNIFVSGIGRLYGTLGDSTSITVTGASVHSYIYGVRKVLNDGEISGGEFTITAVDEFAITPVDEFGISRDEVTVPAYTASAYGIGALHDNSKVSGGKFTVTGAHAIGILGVYGNSEVSGGTFTLTGDETTDVGDVYGNGKVSGGQFTYRTPQLRPTSAPQPQSTSPIGDINCRFVTHNDSSITVEC